MFARVFFQRTHSNIIIYWNMGHQEVQKKKKRLGCWIQINFTNFTPRTQQCFAIYSNGVHYTRPNTRARLLILDPIRAWNARENLVQFSDNILTVGNLLLTRGHRVITFNFRVYFWWYIVFLVNKLLAPLCVRSTPFIYMYSLLL